MPDGRENAGGKPSCPGCRGTDWRRVVEQEGHTWRRCAGCGLVCLVPMPAEAAARSALGADSIGRSYIDGYRDKIENKMRRSARRIGRLARRMPGKRLLDVGSNIGAAIEAARRIGLEGTGIEINGKLLAFARETYPACRFVAGAIETAPFDDGAFEGIYCSEVIEHAPDQDRFVAGLARHLRGGGVLYLTTPGAHEFVRGGRALPRHFGAPDHKVYHTRRSLAALLLRHGFARPRFLFNFGRGHKLFAVKVP